MEKKTPKKTPAPKKAAAPKAKAAPKKPAANKGTAAEVRTKQEEGSIAPASSNLVSAFAMFKKRNISTAGPTVTRLAAGAALPKPPAPKVVLPPAPIASTSPVAPPPTPTLA